MDRILNMILRRLVNKGINSGIRAVSNRGSKQDDDAGAQRQMNRQGQQNARKVRQATRMLRRINKF